MWVYVDEQLFSLVRFVFILKKKKSLNLLTKMDKTRVNSENSLVTILMALVKMRKKRIHIFKSKRSLPGLTNYSQVAIFFSRITSLTFDSCLYRQFTQWTRNWKKWLVKYFEKYVRTDFLIWFMLFSMRSKNCLITNST